MVRKLGGEDDAFVSYRTAHYKLHYYETASNLRMVMLTDPATMSMRNVLHQIYINLWVEYGAYLIIPILFSFSLPFPMSEEKRRVLTWARALGRGGLYIVVKNPLSPVEHKGGAGVRNELFEIGLEQFIRGLM